MTTKKFSKDSTKKDAAPLESIFLQYKDRVFNTVVSYVQNFHDAEEITQDVFVEVFRSFASFRSESGIGTWIYRIAVNKSLDYLRYKKRKKRAQTFARYDEIKDTSCSHPADFHHPGIVLENKEKSAILFKAIDRLPDKQKTIFILVRIEGLGQEEAARVAGISVKAVESILQRGAKNLREWLTEYKTLFQSEGF